MTHFNFGNKFRAVRTYSELCQREFDSKLEARRAEELYFLQKAGEISDLEYQVVYTLFTRPKVTISIDFKYSKDGQTIYEDAKGLLERDFRTKLCWLNEKYGISVILAKGKRLEVDEAITKPIPKSKDKRKQIAEILTTYKESQNGFYKLDDAVNEILSLR